MGVHLMMDLVFLHCEGSKPVRYWLNGLYVTCLQPVLCFASPCCWVLSQRCGEDDDILSVCRQIGCLLFRSILLWEGFVSELSKIAAEILNPKRPVVNKRTKGQFTSVSADSAVSRLYHPRLLESKPCAFNMMWYDFVNVSFMLLTQH